MKIKTSLLYVAKRVGLILNQMNLSNTPHEFQTILRIHSVDFSNNPTKLLLQKWSKSIILLGIKSNWMKSQKNTIYYLQSVKSK